MLRNAPTTVAGTRTASAEFMIAHTSEIPALYAITALVSTAILPFAFNL